MSDIIRNETAHAINGVPGRLFTLRRPPAPWKAGTFANQTWASERRPIDGYGKGAALQVNIRFDDTCKNGHNDFAITGEVRISGRRDCEARGCLHDDIAQVFPELAHLIKWHLSSTDGPTHYVSNACYLAGDRDYNGRAKGEPSRWMHGVRFGNSPITHELKSDKFREFLKDFPTPSSGFVPVAVEHNDNEKPGSYQYAPKYTVEGYECLWYQCPFDSLQEAQEWAQALNTLPFEFVKVPTEFSKGKERELNSARIVAVWPDATDEQLSVPREELEQVLRDRLPALLVAFRADIEAAGFMWECPQEVAQ